MKMELISEQRAGQKGEKTKKDEKLVYNLEEVKKCKLI